MGFEQAFSCRAGASCARPRVPPAPRSTRWVNHCERASPPTAAGRGRRGGTRRSRRPRWFLVFAEVSERSSAYRVTRGRRRGPRLRSGGRLRRGHQPSPTASPSRAGAWRSAGRGAGPRQRLGECPARQRGPAYPALLPSPQPELPVTEADVARRRGDGLLPSTAASRSPGSTVLLCRPGPVTTSTAVEPSSARATPVTARPESLQHRRRRAPRHAAARRGLRAPGARVASTAGGSFAFGFPRRNENGRGTAFLSPR